MKAKNAKKEEVAQAREDQKAQKERKRLQVLAEKEAWQKRKEEATEAKVAKQKWDVQQAEFEKCMRAILWEKAPLNGVFLQPLHMDLPHHKFARKIRIGKL
ncbi:hypothetical protein L7F22_054477 [Adiantum nelumboides]|nr:hypothetical protein [Adiantum nelumboides]